MTDKKYCIQLAECDGDSKDVYSYDEVEIGTWVDGKPIYRKVIAGKLAKNNGNSIVFANVSELKINKLINLYGNLEDKVYKGQITLQASYNRTDGLAAAVNMYYDDSSASILYHYLDNGGAYSEATTHVIIEYTKK